MRIVGLIMMTICATCAMRAPENPVERVEWYQKMHSGIERLSESSDSESAIKGLGEYVRKFGRSLAERDATWLETFERARRELLSIPGHAEFYSKPIWESYAAYRDPQHPKHTGSLTWFSREIQYGMETLKHLPSPETVKALGEMLSEDWEHEPFPNTDVAPAQSMAKYAVTAMTLLNLRDAPSAAIEQYSAPKVLSEWQAWYVQIKSGQRALSFKGQAVEYRFKSDGSWDTIPIANPPDDAQEVPEARPASERPVTQKAQEPLLGNARKAFRPYLLVALAGLLALAASWFGLRRMKAGK